eukprot:5003335-Pleurochrysis_carterae.AAC.2
MISNAFHSKYYINKTTVKALYCADNIDIVMKAATCESALCEQLCEQQRRLRSASSGVDGALGAAT